ncbi:MAG: hypothetical protein WBM14_11520 [Terracidiphilus sp.]
MLEAQDLSRSFRSIPAIQNVSSKSGLGYVPEEAHLYSYLSGLG